jgi:hypothetical protein
MPTTIDCPSCHRALRLPDEYIGRPVQCPGCSHTFTATRTPAPAEAVVVPPEAPPAPAGPDVPPAPAAEHKAQPPPADAPPPRRRDDDDRRPPRYADDVEPCPYCDEPISLDATRCPHCRRDLSDEYEVDDRPWEQEGEVRRDCDPHRGGVVLTLGIVGLAVFPVGFCPCIGLVTLLVGLGTGIPAWVMGQRDLGRMRRGDMDPQGRGTTLAGMICGIIAVVFAAIGVIIQLFVVGINLMHLI